MPISLSDLPREDHQRIAHKWAHTFLAFAEESYPSLRWVSLRPSLRLSDSLEDMKNELKSGNILARISNEDSHFDLISIWIYHITDTRFWVDNVWIDVLEGMVPVHLSHAAVTTA